MRFTGKTALITGAGSGIGRATAQLLAREGARELVLIDTNDSSLSQLSLTCDIQAVAADVAEEASWRSGPLKTLPPIDHAVVNAGVASAGPIAELSFEEWRRVLAVNLDGAFLTLRTALRTLRHGGSIVVVASSAGI
jgi:NAD(P)-dependent dehydrogenase (short-subunit alcohol dehydrogenase family)